MIFSLDVRRARKGDCLLLHFGSKDKPGLVMIDGGPRSVYKPHLKPRLLEIKARRLDKQKPLPVDMLMVSHVDDDHIQGILDLTGEMTQTPAAQARMLRIQRLWHNSFDELIGKDPKELTAAFGAAQFGAAATSGELPDDATVEMDEEEEVIVGSLKVLASIDQGHRLRGDAGVLGIPLPKKLVMAKDVLKMGNLEFLVAGPMQPELKRLQDKHDAWLKERQAKGDTGESALAAYVDESVPNLSSIVVLAKAGGKTMLLTGDARGDKILKGLEMVGALEAPNGKMHVDLLKVPHHGSANNLDKDFFVRIMADHYVFSGNGEHGNPERDAIEMLIEARGDDPFQIHLTYPIEEIDVAREADWKKEQAKETKRKKAGGKKPVREDWSSEKHGLAALIKKAKLAEKLHIVDDTKPHVIDLLDPLGY